MTRRFCARLKARHNKVVKPEFQYANTKDFVAYIEGNQKRLGNAIQLRYIVLTGNETKSGKQAHYSWTSIRSSVEGCV